MQSPTQRKGAIGEKIAERYLVGKGWKIIERNIKVSGEHRLAGELDLICDDRGVTVFVEVKFRQSDHYGDPAEAVTREKLDRLRHAIVGYLAQHRITHWRLDVLAIMPINDRARITHYRDVLQYWS